MNPNPKSEINAITCSDESGWHPSSHFGSNRRNAMLQ